MKTRFIHLLCLLAACLPLVLTGCGPIMLVRNTDVPYDGGAEENPFEKAEVCMDQGWLRVRLADRHKDMGEIRVTEAALTGEDRHALPLEVRKQARDEGWERDYSCPVFNVDLYFVDPRHNQAPPFHLLLKGEYDSKPFIFDGRFSEHAHYHLVNILRELNV